MGDLDLFDRDDVEPLAFSDSVGAAGTDAAAGAAGVALVSLFWAGTRLSFFTLLF